MVVIISKSYMRLFLLAMAVCCVAVSYIFWYFEPRRINGKLSELTLLIDPGHGGVDGGTQDHHGNLEKDVNLKIALKVRDQLQESGMRIVMTREHDTDLAPFRSGRTGRHRRDLLNRIEKALKHRCLFLVSIHCDSSVETRRKGAFAFYNYHSRESKGLALTIQEELNKVQQKSFTSAPGKYLIIRQKGVTGVLVEVGFLSNYEEANLLQNDSYQDKLAMAIAAGILKYCHNLIN